MESDNKALLVAKRLKAEFPKVEFIEVDVNKDLPFENKEDVLIIDTVEGIDRLEILENEDLDKIKIPSSTTVHDFDLAFQLKYLKKLGKLGNVKILGIPQKGDLDHDLIHSIVRKLVAQDIQGS